jgi:hypothetical protein
VIRLFTAPTVAEVGLLKGLLEAQEIPCVLRNEYTSIAAGSVPFTDAWPELWVLREADIGRARQILNGWQSNATDHEGQSWLCPECCERMEGQFAACWNCGHDKSV